MNLKAIRGSYGDFGRMSKGMILKDISRERAEKLIASGAYAEAMADDLNAAEKTAAPVAGKQKRKGKTGPTGKSEATADDLKAELEKLTNDQLRDVAKAEDIAVESDDNKAGLVDKIIAGRAATA